MRAAIIALCGVAAFIQLVIELIGDEVKTPRQQTIILVFRLVACLLAETAVFTLLAFSFN